VVIVAKELTDEDRDRLNRGVERVIQKSDRDERLQQLSREVAKCIKREARGAENALSLHLRVPSGQFDDQDYRREMSAWQNANCPSAPSTSG
jgi:hypothetical protein